jgi:GNAT superfamily N-acetyltransferase
MPNKIIIRPAEPGDISGMCALLEDLFSLESDFHPEAGKQRHALSLMIGDRSGNSFVLVAQSGAEIAGMATVQTLVSTAEGGRSGLVEDVVVKKEYRGCGIGTRLLDGIISWARQQHLRRLQLLADRSNQRALDFYQGRQWITTNLICLRKIL